MTTFRFDDSALPPDVYHYTSGVGLLGILKSQSLWATHAAYLNDAQEIAYGLNSVVGELRQMANLQEMPEELDHDDLWSTLKRLPLTRLDTIKLVLTFIVKVASDRVTFLQQNAGPFVACLSRVGDQLSQWRGYSGNGGYAIRFDTSALCESVKATQLGAQLELDDPSLEPMELGTRYFITMRYSAEPDLIHRGLLSFISGLLKHLSTRVADESNFDKARFDEIGQQMLRQRAGWILGIAVQTKNPGFEEEKEYRIVTFDEPGIFHSTHIGLVPRVDIEFDPACIKEVIVGPGANLDLRQSSIEYYKKTHRQYSHVKVSVSDTPFRGI
jgi:hypothetical protein